MVDIIGGANAVTQTVQVVDGGQDVLHGDGAADQLVVVAAEHFLLLLHIGGGVEDLLDLIKEFLRYCTGTRRNVSLFRTQLRSGR